METKKEKKQNNIFVTLLVILMAVAVIVAIAGTVARDNTLPEKKEAPETSSRPSRDAALREDRVHDAEEEVTLPDTENVETDSPEDTHPEEEKKDVIAEEEEKLPDFSCPVSGEVLKGYSVDVPVFSVTMEDYRTHGGIDIYAGEGTEVSAAADGEVMEIWEDPMMGNCISLSHAGGAVTTYKNMSASFPEGLKPGDTVKSGQVIGTVGDTALEEVAEESHLHFELTVDGVSADPADYLTFPVMNDFSE